MIYLDHASTTPLKVCAGEAMAPWCQGSSWGNASSMHSQGRQVRQVLEDCREKVAELVGCRARDVIFTSGATEANTLALRGASLAWNHLGGLAVSRLEHPSIVETAEQLSREGVNVTWISPDSEGMITAQTVSNSIDESTKLVATMLANNEIGHVTNLSEIVRLCESKKIQVHTDATQAIGHMKVNFQELGVDTMSFSGHKIGGPSGVGVLIARRQAQIGAIQRGGSQELGRRSGTENILGIVGLTAALEESCREFEECHKKWMEFRGILESQLQGISGVVLNSVHPERLPHIVNVSFEGIEGEALLIRLDMEGICVSSGSACHADHPEPSHVLKALGRPSKLAKATVRFSFGPGTTEDEIISSVSTVKKLVHELRQLSFR